MKALIVGYGSIGRRHHHILSQINEITQCDVITKQQLVNIKTFTSLQESDLDYYDYIVIASKTSLHYEQLSYIEKKVQGKIILVEKPLFSCYKELFIQHNKVFVAYNRRFYPILKKIKKLCSKDKCYYANVITGQYLPQWRETRDYTQSYSAKKDEGGGVLLDLSHELDYLSWIFPAMQILYSYDTKVSDLEIDSDDLCIVIAKSGETLINMSIDYISKEFQQKITIHLQSSSIYADLQTMQLVQIFKNNTKKKYDFSQYTRNYSFKKMHQSILFGTQKRCCSYKEGLKVMEYIQNVQERRDE
jgi:predicted dehydrogenase